MGHQVIFLPNKSLPFTSKVGKIMSFGLFLLSTGFICKIGIIVSLLIYLLIFVLILFVFLLFGLQVLFLLTLRFVLYLYPGLLLTSEFSLYFLFFPFKNYIFIFFFFTGSFPFAFKYVVYLASRTLTSRTQHQVDHQ